MKISFVTTNKHKFEELKAVLAEFDIEVEQIKASYPEDKEDLMEQVALKGAKMVSTKLNKAIVLEDTGLFFEAYTGFPGAMPKFIFEKIGYDGIFRLLKDKNRNAYFKTVAAYCEPGSEPVLFEGMMKGKITEKVYDEQKEAMPYDRIFVPIGYDVTISDMEIETKNSFSQRAQAFKKLARYLLDKESE
ncbi:MAG: non-canonical purine NTP pyrophosphatase [Nanoarchaeota archaeon]|nr:non-canonical purine NTP pyrophosphatase [Nanoarchaeota archaeon]